MTPSASQIRIAQQNARILQLDPTLVCAICHHESLWNTWAARYEPGFWRRYITPMRRVERFGPTISKRTERRLRSTSLGLMQVMGQVAREYGFAGESLTELCSPGIGIRYGCLRLRRALDRTGNIIEAALLRYNGGGNPEYPNLVLRHMKKYEEMKYA